MEFQIEPALELPFPMADCGLEWERRFLDKALY